MDFWAAEIFSSQLLVGQFLVSDVGSDHFLIPTNGRDKVSARPEFVAEKIASCVRHGDFVNLIPAAVELPVFAPP